MATITISPELYDRLVDKIRHGLLYAEASRQMLEDLQHLLDAAKEGSDDG